MTSIRTGGDLGGLPLPEFKRALGEGPLTDRRALWLRQDHRCFYCDRECLWLWPSRKAAREVKGRLFTVDHVVPRSQGGGHSPKVGACADCNVRRGVTPAHLFITWIAQEQGIAR